MTIKATAVWTPDKTSLKRPVYISLIAQISEAIREGKLRSGDRLPTHRELAFELNVSVQTVSRAYEGLVKRGLIAGSVGRGTYVLETRGETQTPYLPTRPGESLIDFSIQKPISDKRHQEAVRRALAQLHTDISLERIFAFRPNIALDAHKQAALPWLLSCGVQCPSENILVTNGATAGLNVAFLCVARSGSAIAAEPLVHHAIIPLANYLGLEMIPVASDHEGMLPEALQSTCESKDICAIFCTPNASNPRAAVMSEGRREQIAKIARKNNQTLIEDDAWGPLPGNNMPPLWSFAPDNTIYITSLTKCLMPALRIGYLVAPPQLVAPARNRHLVTNWMASTLLADIAQTLLQSGEAQDLLTWQREQLYRRNALASARLMGLRHHSHPFGLHIWLPIPQQWREDQFVAQARASGVALAPSAPFMISPSEPQGAGFVRASIGAPSDANFDRGLTILRNLIASEPEPMLMAF